MALPMIPILALLALFLHAIYNDIIYPYFLSPLSKIPNAHWSAPFSRLWILSYRRREEETPAVHEAHQRLGPIVRLAPNEISVNNVDGGIRTVYAGGYEKGDWYLNVFSNYGVMPMFAMPDHGPHSKRKRMLSNVYAKSTLQSSPSLRAISHALLDERLMPRLKDLSAKGECLDFYYIFAALTHDFVSSYIFGLGNGSDFLRQPAEAKKFFDDFKARQRYQFWPQELPRLTSFLSKIWLQWLLVPSWVGPANRDIEAMIRDMCNAAEETLADVPEDDQKPNKAGAEMQNWPNVYAQLRNALMKDMATNIIDVKMSVVELVERQKLEMASEMLDHTLAGFDTSSIVLTFFSWEISRPEHKEWQKKLRDELKHVADIHDAKAVDSLPLLHAMLMETLRLHAAIPGNQPRITPPSATLSTPGHELTGLPAGVRVQAQAWSLHRNPDVFPEPETWNPARWLSPEKGGTSNEAQLKEMGRWFWAFGSGGRMCVGSNLAMFDMKAIIAAIWSRFETKVEYAEGMVHRGGYVAEPVGKDGKYCVLKLGDV
ncbi:cytochrome P450 [Hortaea werneckii]|uniref:Cytochrome P450 n=1 Tax=Hortaea werneckii TaxID=91943 RepID=A0A3M7IL48_HORWE|nr:cytochrome P450 [Hortaea werneckii]KAI6832750.1 cytochrome P450 [Hortaea werneckii]KAI6915464.1 cytochrome P450 [Hortaea werneckii]KAI6934016.1 cytochrome P450 [Hortaea werneckii]KAI6965115.1 cytochrome P450 [Hortaea werneckii]